MITALLAAAAIGQLPGLGNKLPGIPGLDAIFKKGPAITTSLKDCKWEAIDKDSFDPKCEDLFKLERGPNDGFILRAGAWESTQQSYCLKAGTHGPGGGEGYIYAPPKGPLEKAVIAIVQNSVDHAEITQYSIQLLLWAIIARTKLSDMSSDLQSTAAKLLTPQQMMDLNGGALGVLTDDKLAGAFIKEPPLIRQVFEAEAKLRSAFTNHGSTYADFERIAVLTGDAPWGKDSRVIPTGRWSLHPDGYYVRYVPWGYSQTRLQVFVEEGSKAVGLEFNPATHIAVPGNTARQRLIQSARKFGSN